MGLFDDLSPGASPSGGAGLFDDLAPPRRAERPKELPERSIPAAVNDTVIDFANAAAGGVGLLANFVSPGNRVTAFIDENIVKPGQERQSDRKKAISANFAQDLDEADGILDEISAAARYAMADPAGILAQAGGSFVIPAAAVKGAGMLARTAGLGSKGVTRAGLGGGAVAGAALGGGDAAGQAYEEALGAGATEEQAQGAARQATVIPALVGGVGGMLGAERIFAGGRGFAGGRISRGVKTGLSEAGQEAIEEGVTQYEANRAVVPFDGRDPTKGVAAAATLGALMGGPVGGVIGAMSPGRQDAPTPDQEKLAEGLGKIATAGSVDEVIAAAAETVTGETRRIESPQGLRDLRGEIAMLDATEQREAMELLATSTSTSPRASDGVRRFAQNRLDELLRDVRQPPVGEATEELPTGEATELLSESQEKAQEQANIAMWLKRSQPMDLDRAEAVAERGRILRGLDLTVIPHGDRGYTVVPSQWLAPSSRIPAGDATEIVPTGEASEVLPVGEAFEDVPTGEVVEDIPAGDAAEMLPTGEASELIPTGEATEEPARKIPTSKATEIEPEQILADDLLTGDGFPYGSKVGASVRAKREGLGPENVVQVPGGWIVRPQPTTPDRAGIEVQPAGTRGTTAADILRATDDPNAARTAGPRAADAGRGDGSGVLRDEPAGDVAESAAAPSGEGVGGGGAAGPGGRGADAALRGGLKEELTRAYRVANQQFGNDIVASGIQNDWQRLLDAAEARDVDALSKLEQKYQRDEGRDGMGAGTSGAGPGKVKQARRGAAQLPRFARALRQAIENESPPPQAGADAALTDLADRVRVAKGRVRELMDAPTPDPDAIMAASEADNRASGALRDRIANVPDDAFGVSAKTSDGRDIVLTPSAQNPGQWQLTRFGRDGQPWGDSQYTNKARAVEDFIREADTATLRMAAAAPSPTPQAGADAALTADDAIDPFTLNKRDLNARINRLVAAGEAADSISGFMALRQRYMRATGKPSIPPPNSRFLPLYPEGASPTPQAQAVTPAEGPAMTKAPARTALDDVRETAEREDAETEARREATIKRLVAEGAKPERVVVGRTRKPAAEGGDFEPKYAWRLPAGDESYVDLTDSEAAALRPGTTRAAPAGEGAPKVYKTRAGAMQAKKEAGNTKRLKKVKGGYILREATNKEFEAAARAGRRMSAPRTVDTENDSLLTAIAKLGGLAMSERADTIGGRGNRNVGGKMLFTRDGRPLDDLADEVLRDLGYVPAAEVERDGGTSWLRDAIRAEYDGRKKHYSEAGSEWIEEAQRRYEEGMGDPNEDVLADLTPDDLDSDGYTAASPEVQAMTERLIAEATAQGIDAEALAEDAARITEGKTEDEYHQAFQAALSEAVARSRGDGRSADAGAAQAGRPDRGAADGEEGGGQEGLTLSAQSEQDLRDKADREAAAARADAAEQKRRADKAKADSERDEFTLTGSDRPADVAAASGQRDIFDAPAEPAQPTPAADRRKDPTRRKQVAEMTPDEMRRELLTDDLTGLNNGRWLRENQPQFSHIIAFDADSLKWVNDNMGHDSGDALLKAWGEALKQATPNAARSGGDEFFALANSQAEAQTIAQAVEKALSEAVITASTPDGDVTIKGIGASFGIAADKKAADEALNKHKQAREQAGARAGRGEQPPGTTRRFTQGQQDQVDQGGRQDDSAAQPAPARYDKRKIELRKRLAVLRNLKECLG